MSEYQGEPMRPDMSDSPRATPELIASRVNGIPRGVLPAAAEYLTGMIDVHDSALYWCVVGWSPRYDGWICDYSTWPQQNLAHFSTRKAPNTLAMKYPGMGREASIRQGLLDLVAALCTREFQHRRWCDAADRPVAHRLWMAACGRVRRLLTLSTFRNRDAKSGRGNFCLEAPHQRIRQKAGRSYRALLVDSGGRRPASTAAFSGRL